MDSNGGNPRRLTDRHPEPDTAWVWLEAWSPDGQSIYYSDNLPPGQSYIIKLKAGSGESTTLTARMWDRPFYIAVNQDGSKILYLASCDQGAMDFCFHAKSVGQDGTGDETHETMQIKQVCTDNKGI